MRPTADMYLLLSNLWLMFVIVTENWWFILTVIVWFVMAISLIRVGD